VHRCTLPTRCLVTLTTALHTIHSYICRWVAAVTGLRVALRFHHCLTVYTFLPAARLTSRTVTLALILVGSACHPLPPDSALPQLLLLLPLRTLACLRSRLPHLDLRTAVRYTALPCPFQFATVGLVACPSHITVYLGLHTPYALVPVAVVPFPCCWTCRCYLACCRLRHHVGFGYCRYAHTRWFYAFRVTVGSCRYHAGYAAHTYPTRITTAVVSRIALITVWIQHTAALYMHLITYLHTHHLPLTHAYAAERYHARPLISDLC